jgi:hypothetical protein
VVLEMGDPITMPFSGWKNWFYTENIFPLELLSEDVRFVLLSY